jgi:hypothetical protein
MSEGEKTFQIQVKVIDSRNYTYESFGKGKGKDKKVSSDPNDDGELEKGILNIIIIILQVPIKFFKKIYNSNTNIRKF